MSILIKGIDIPKCSNEDCIVVIRHDKAEVWQTGYKERTVEAIQIDRPHGRLIDADKLADDLQADGEEFGEDLKLNCASWLRSNANAVILEAENECERCKHKGDEYWCRDAYTGNDGKCSIAEEE